MRLNTDRRGLQAGESLREQTGSEPARRRPITRASLAAALTQPGIILLFWLAALVVVWRMTGELPQRATRVDFSIYYLSATVLHRGQNPYTADFVPLGQR